MGPPFAYRRPRASPQGRGCPVAGRPAPGLRHCPASARRGRRHPIRSRSPGTAGNCPAGADERRRSVLPAVRPRPCRSLLSDPSWLTKPPPCRI